ncbi:ComEA family DNA-binding protein [Nocardia yunnanensis]|uniref:ComEA family DNA-binding protein n=1 Tax=Nocardia yunnanensis TaxID=2382165 RepID=A0A386Z8R5_9NOCA|nr:ComEA family DNA-binding protein [Nocardia yunnanensis]AYF74041.1 ComEA family DNA-binding protein [Nocardia yunnanensis]
MPQLDERTPPGHLPSPLHRLAGRPHPARWDEESLDQLGESGTATEAEPGPAAPASAPEASGISTPAWLSEPCGSVSLWHERLVPERFRGTRWDPGPRGVLVIAALGLLAILLAGYVALREEPVSHPVPPIASLTDTVPGDTIPGDAVPADAAAGAPDAVAATSGAPRPPVSRSVAPQPDRVPLAPTATALPAPSATPSELVVSVVGLVEHGGLRRFPPGARVADALRAAAPLPEADLSTLNLAQPLTDGDQIIVARTTSRPTTPASGTTLVKSGSPAANSPPASGAPPRPTGVPGKVNLNTASESELDALPGVGPVTAKAILEWRTRHGRFTSIDQLAEIQGIGHSRLNRLRDRVTI